MELVQQLVMPLGEKLREVVQLLILELVHGVSSWAQA
jgi:hypothetical protein